MDIEQRPASRRADLAAIAALVLFTAVLYRPLFRHETYSMVGAHMYAQYPWTAIVHVDPRVEGRGYAQTDEAETFYPLYTWATNTVWSGEFPMWMAYSFAGFPIIELGLHGLLYPPRMMLMPVVSEASAHDILLFVHLLIGGIGMYAFCRTLGLNVAGSILAGGIWEANGHNAFWLLFEQVPLAAAWLPWMLLAATLAVRRVSFRWAIWSGMFSAMCVLTGMIQVAYISALLLGLWYVCFGLYELRRVQADERTLVRVALLPVVTAVVAVGLSAPMWMPLAGSLPTVHRQTSSLAVQVSERVTPVRVLRALFFPRASDEMPPGGDWGTLFFIGVPALALAAFGLWMRRRSFIGRFSFFVLLLLAPITIGFAPLLAVLRLMPFFAAIHVFHAGYLFTFFMSVLAAAGVTAIADGFAAMPAQATMLTAALVLVNLAQLAIMFWRIEPEQPRDAQWLFPETAGIRAARAIQHDYRVLPVHDSIPGAWTPPVLAGKVAAIFALHSASGYESLIPEYVAGMWRTVEQGGQPTTTTTPAYRPYFYFDQLPIDLLEKLSVGVLIAPPGVVPRDIRTKQPPGPDRMVRIYGGNDLWIYRLNRALPRAFLSPAVVGVPNESAALAMLTSPQFDPRRTTIVIGTPPATLGRGDGQPLPADRNRASIVTDRQNTVELNVVADRPSMLVLQDTWDDDWRALVDGHESPVLRVNYAFRGVMMQPGRHHIVFEYRPRLLLAGFITALATLLAAAILFVVGRR